MRGPVCWASLLTLLASSLAAQVNTERLRRTDPDSGLAGQAGLDVTLRAGNVEILLLVPRARLDYTAERWNAFVVVQGDFGWQRGERFSNQALGHVRYGYHLSRLLTAETFFQLDYDRARKLRLRTLLGLGPRLTLLSSRSWQVALGTAYMFEHEELELPPEAIHPIETDAHRWTNYLTAQGAAGERLRAVGTAYAQPRVDDFGDLRLLGDARLAVQLVGTLSLQVSFLLRWDRRPPDQTDQLDFTLRTGVGVEW